MTGNQRFISSLLCLFLLPLSVGSQAFADNSIGSVYTTKAEGDNIAKSDVWARLKKYCSVTATDDETGDTTFSCKGPEGSGYSLSVGAHEHGYGTTILHLGNETDAYDEFTQLGKAHHWNLPKGWEISWADWGLASGIFEWRYKDLGNGKRNYFALIFRHNFTALAMKEDSSEMKDLYVSSALLIFKLDGQKTQLYAAIDSIAAYNGGANANELAQACADGLLQESGEPNDACKVYDAFDEAEKGIEPQASRLQ